MKLEPQILHDGLDQVAFGVASIKKFWSRSRSSSLLSLFAAIAEARKQRSISAAGWLAGAAIVEAGKRMFGR